MLPGDGTHKIEVSNPALAGRVLSLGGRFIGDYGSYQLYQIPDVPEDLRRNTEVRFRDEYNFVLLNAARLDTRRSDVQALRKTVAKTTEKRLHIVQFAGPVQPDWHGTLATSGAQIITYLPHNAYLVYGDGESRQRIQQMAADSHHIQWEGPFADKYKIHPTARPFDGKGRPRSVGTDWFAVQLVADAAANQDTLRLLDQLKLEDIRQDRTQLGYRNIVLRLSAQDLVRIAAQPEVVSIQPYFIPAKLCERQDQIIAGSLSGGVPTGPGYLDWLGARGFDQSQFSASAFVVDVSDSGIDNGTVTPDHPGLYKGAMPGGAGSRVVYSRLEGTPNPNSTLAGCDGHGTLNGHIIAGYNSLSGFPYTDAQGFHYGLGVCPYVRLGFSVVFDPDNFTFPDFTELQSAAYDSGARISNNSWGSSANGAYDINAQLFDALTRDAQPTNSTYAAVGNQAMVMIFPAGNSGPNPQSVVSPGAAKNIISVGAGENVQALGSPDASGIGDDQADNANDIPGFSSRGPCADGRHKPDLVAPGTHVSGGVPQAPDPGTNGQADACYTGDGISGGAGGEIFYPAGQQFYTASSGTSHSAPCVSGGCALVRQYFINQYSDAPSPAMTKAFLMNSARYLTGVNANDNLWSDNQGMGEMDLGMAFDGTPRILRDQLPPDIFTASGQARTFLGTLSDTNKPLRVTLAWTDAPGSTAGNAFNNNLDLTVTIGGKVYLGNVFQGPYSITGGDPDGVNNVESVFLPPGISGNFIIKVIGTDINSDGVPNNGTALDQDFALVVYNGIATNAPVINGTAATLTAETCSPTNGVIDPGERVTVSFALQNLGTRDTTNLVATLQADSNVIAPSGQQIYGTLLAGGPPVARPFSFTANGACGSELTATIALQDGADGLGVAVFTMPLGLAFPTVPLAENFDGVVEPALPTAWNTSTSGGGSAWSTGALLFMSAPNAVAVPDSPSAGVGELVSPVVQVSSHEARLTFANNYDLEADPWSPLAYDGGVLELKIGNGPYADLLAAGGSFESGGYTLTIDSTGDNPLGGRRAWGGSSGGFVTTRAKLPRSAAGQTVQLRWRLGTDTGNANGGSAWYIDDVVISDTTNSCCIGPAAPTITGISLTATNVTITCTSQVGLTYSLECKDSLSDAQWLSLPPAVAGTGGPVWLVDTNIPSGRRFYRIEVH